MAQMLFGFWVGGSERERERANKYMHSLRRGENAKVLEVWVHGDKICLPGGSTSVKLQHPRTAAY